MKFQRISKPVSRLSVTLLWRPLSIQVVEMGEGTSYDSSLTAINIEKTEQFEHKICKFQH